MTTMPPENEATTASAPAPRSGWLASLPRLVLVALLVALVATFYALGLHRYVSWDYLRSNVDFLQAQVREHLVLALLAFFLAYAAATALSLPIAAPLSLVAGALFDRWLGTGVVALGATLGATLAMLCSRYLFRDFVQRRFGARLKALNEGVERDGAYYLFTLRLVPLFPFFLINLGMGLTRMRVSTFFWVSLVGMLPGTFLYVNAGRELARIDAPADVLSPTLLVSLALLGIVPLVFRKLVQWKVRIRTIGITLGLLAVLAAVGLGVRTKLRYATAETMDVPLREYTNAEYPEDPANRSAHFGKYDGRTLTLVQKDDTHFDFVLAPTDDRTAKIGLHDVDVSLMTPSVPAWAKADDGLRRIALTDRQWNRQQVNFGNKSPQVEITGGNGFEKVHLQSVQLAKNCLNAGLWEVLLFVEEGGQKALYYQGWFTFPLGHYARIFERNTGLPYWKHWYYLEHWFDPAGTRVPLDGLRRVTAERVVPATFDGDEEVLAAGEQLRKRRTVIAENVGQWKDYYDGRKVRFATFIPPGRYSVNHPWKNEYWRLQNFEKAVLREIVSPAGPEPLHELELVFTGKGGGTCRFLVSGFDLKALPQLPVAEYAKGLYMPMGIGTPPFFQSYEELQRHPPERSTYFSVTLDAEDRWINHHELAIDGPVMHRDAENPNVLHVYLLSYERHSLISHFRIETDR
jgi:uncharacterized membrane protein YdjX (TVP38/TMEM64 family)